MKKPKIRIYDVETSEIIDREMNDEEFAQYLKDQESEANRLEKIKAKIDARNELLQKLGITEEEAVLLSQSI